MLEHTAIPAFSPAQVSTWGLLPAFDFRPDTEATFTPRLSCDFGGFRLSATCVTNMRFQDVVLLTGTLATERSVGDVWFEMPRYVASREHCAAWIVWHLDQYSGFTGLEHSWIAEGRLHQSLLPWVIELVAYEARPYCSAQRPWMRLALKTLAQYLTTADDKALVELGFDGAVLSIRYGGKVVALPAEGRPWVMRYIIPVEKLRHLPKRLMNEEVGVSVWESRLSIDRWSYEGVMQLVGNPSSQVHP